MSCHIHECKTSGDSSNQRHSQLAGAYCPHLFCLLRSVTTVARRVNKDNPRMCKDLTFITKTEAKDIVPSRTPMDSMFNHLLHRFISNMQVTPCLCMAGYNLYILRKATDY